MRIDPKDLFKQSANNAFVSNAPLKEKPSAAVLVSFNSLKHIDLVLEILCKVCPGLIRVSDCLVYISANQDQAREVCFTISAALHEFNSSIVKHPYYTNWLEEYLEIHNLGVDVISVIENTANSDEVLGHIESKHTSASSRHERYEASQKTAHLAITHDLAAFVKAWSNWFENNWTGMPNRDVIEDTVTKAVSVFFSTSNGISFFDRFESRVSLDAVSAKAEGACGSLHSFPPIGALSEPDDVAEWNANHKKVSSAVKDFKSLADASVIGDVWRKSSRRISQMIITHFGDLKPVASGYSVGSEFIPFSDSDANMNFRLSRSSLGREAVHCKDGRYSSAIAGAMSAYLFAIATAKQKAKFSNSLLEYSRNMRSERLEVALPRMVKGSTPTSL